jgi:hypothetical protein
MVWATPGLAEIGHEHPVSHACTRARYVRLAPFSFLILIHRFVSLACGLTVDVVQELPALW